MLATREPLFEAGEHTENYDQKFWSAASDRLRAAVRSEQFHNGDNSEVQMLYNHLYSDLNLMGCGRFWGYAAAAEEFQSDIANG